MQADSNAVIADIRAAQKGDERAFERLLDMVEKPVYRLALSITRRREDAEDATQEALIKLWRALPDYRFECPLLPYALQIARNAALDIVRREAATRQNTVSLSQESEHGEEVTMEVADTDEFVDPARAYERKETIEAVRRGISELPDEYREILTLKDIEGLSYEQIRRVLTLEQGTVKSRLSRARKKLLEILKRRNIF